MNASCYLATKANMKLMKKLTTTANNIRFFLTDASSTGPSTFNKINESPIEAEMPVAKNTLHSFASPVLINGLESSKSPIDTEINNTNTLLKPILFGTTVSVISITPYASKEVGILGLPLLVSYKNAY
jgi:hypothetical protein